MATHLNYMQTPVWYHTPINETPKRLRQEDCESEPICALEQEAFSRNKECNVFISHL